MHAAFETVRYLARKGSWSVLDQALFAGANAVLNILVARSLGPEGFGMYAVAYAVYLLLHPIHGALLVEPMLVFGAGRYRDAWPAYLRQIVVGHVLVTLSASVVLLGVWFVTTLWRPLDLADALLMLAVAAPFMLFQMLMRRASYAVHRPHWAALAGVPYLVLVVGGALLLDRTGAMSAANALGLMGAAGLVSGAALAPALGLLRPVARDAVFARDVLRKHFEYGRWAVGYRLLRWVPKNLAYLLLPAFGGLGATGTLKAMQVLFMPLTQANSAFSAIVLPNLVAARTTGRFMRKVWLVLGALVTGALGYVVLVGAGGGWLLGLLYGDAYAGAAWILWILGIGAVLGVGREMLCAAMRALERPDTVFFSELVGTTAFVAAAFFVIQAYGLAGAAWAITIPAVLQSALLVRALLRTRPHPPVAAEPIGTSLSAGDHTGA